MILRRTSIIAIAAAIGLGACGNNTGSACAGPVEEPLDPKSGIHVIDPNDGPTDPAPTSGPHIGVGSPSGVYDETLPAAIQLRILETGQILVQYRDAADLDALVDWRDDATAVAPNPDIDSAIVATASRQRMRCSAVDVDALDKFVDDFARPAP